MFEIGADVLEIDQKTDLARTLDMAQGKACVLGNISPEKLRNDSTEEIKSAVADTLNTSKEYSCFIIGPGCALAGDTPFENIDAMMAVIKNQF